MVVGVLVLLFVGGCAYDDEQSALLQASIKNHHGGAANTQATEKGPVVDLYEYYIDGDYAATKVGEFTDWDKHSAIYPVEIQHNSYDITNDLCPDGFGQIRDESECKEAAKGLGIPMATVTGYTASKHHPGCQINWAFQTKQLNRVSFNRNLTACNINPRVVAVCKKGVTPTPDTCDLSPKTPAPQVAPEKPGEAQCKGGCYNANGILNVENKCGKQNCDGCCECTGECVWPRPKPESAECDGTCYTKKGNLNPSKQCPKNKCAGCCECTGDCPPDLDDLEDEEKGNEISDEHQPVYECAKWCYSKKHKPKPWAEKKCKWYGCSACPECDIPDEGECDQDKCWNGGNKNSGKFKDQFCPSGATPDPKCSGCEECNQAPPKKNVKGGKGRS